MTQRSATKRARRAAPKRAAERSATKRTGPARPSARARPRAKQRPAPAAKQRVAKRVPKQRAVRRAAPKRARRPAPKNRAPRRPAARLKVVKRAPPKPRPAPAAPPAFPQREGASGRQLLIFELLRARAHVLAAIQGLTAAVAEQPLGGGRWTIREAVLHLHVWDLEWERALEPALRGVRPAWMDLGAAELDRLNAELLAPLRALPWDEGVRRLHSGWARLVETIESLPDEPVELWTKEHPMGETLALLPEHDHHHAEAIKRARAEASPQPRTP